MDDKRELCCYWFDSHLTFKCEVCIYMTHFKNDLLISPAKESGGVAYLVSVRITFVP